MSSSHRRVSPRIAGCAVLSLFAMGALFGCAAMDGAVSREAKRHVAEAKRLETEKKVKEALAEYNKAIDASPNYVDAYLGAGACSVRLNQLDNAESAYKRAINLRNTDPEIYHNLGIVYAQKGDLAAAAENLQKAVRYGSKDSNTHVFLGMVYKDQGKFKNAIREYEKSLKMDANNAFAYNNMGIAYVAMKEYDEAEAAYLKAEQADADFADVHFNLGKFYDDVLPNKAKALMHYQRYLDLTKQQDPAILKRMAEIIRENVR
ncbi:MAG: tetratricopeptide repeat protein [Planctomycetota bacterium]